MSKRLLNTAFIPAVLFLAACADSPVATKAPSFEQIAVRPALSELSLRFRAEAPNVVLFDFNKADLDAEARSRLDEQAEWILAHPEVRFRIAGHTDRVGSEAYNQELGLRRAMSVMAYFVERGIDASRLEAMASFGEEAPIINTEEPERVNRRATTEVFGFVKPSSSREAGPGVAVEAPLARGYEPSAPVAILVTPEGEQPPAPAPQNEPTGTVGGSSVAGGGNDPQQPGPGEETGGSPSEPESATSGPTSKDKPGKNSNDGSETQHVDAGRGNGDDQGDPGKSQGKNNGGDEV